MKTYMYNVFSKYFVNYKYAVQSRIGGLIRSSDTEILQICLEELNKLMAIIAGRLTTSLDIPKANKFPSSKEFNTFLSHLDVDLDKLFSGSKLVVNDVQNVVNYNSLERTTISSSLAKIQSHVYNAYILSQKSVTGETVIREDFNTVEAANIQNPDVSMVEVDPNMKRLSLKKLNTDVEKDSQSVNYKMIDCFHYNEQDSTFNLYPNSTDLHIGSYWNVKNNNYHFEYKNDRDSYMKGIIVASNDLLSSFSSCQFESVITIDETNDMEKRIESDFAEYKQIPESFIFITRPLSINGKYITNKNVNPDAVIKLLIPFKNAKLSTGCEIKLSPNDGNEFPNINDDKSFVKATVVLDGLLVTQKIGLISATSKTVNDYGTTKEYTIMFNEPLVPEMLELVFTYENGWPEIEYSMRPWFIQLQKTVNIEVETQGIGKQNKEVVYTQPIYLLVDDEDSAHYSSEQNKVAELFKTTGAK